jgi:hypothetical protein
MRKIICLLAVWGFIAFNASGKVKTAAKPDSNKAEVVMHTDTITVTQRGFDTVALDNYKKLKDFDYKEVRGTNYWDKFWEWVWQLLNKIFGGPKKKTHYGSPIWGDLLLIAACALLVYLIIKLLKLDHIFKRKPAETPVQYSELTDDINAINFERDIANAVTARNYKVAIRLLYLQSLKLMDDAQIINWQIGKTNQAYVHEINNAGQKQAFNTLTYQFEYVWYGDFPVDAAVYQKIEGMFGNFRGMLK